MNVYLNYFIEANIGIALFLGAYLAILARETDFRVQRLFLLIGILVSLTFPLLHVQLSSATIPSLSEIMSPFLLPEVVVGGDKGSATTESAFNAVSLWKYLRVLYVSGLIFFLSRFMVRIAELIMLLKRSRKVSNGKLKIVEFDNVSSTFSFFHYIILGQSKSLSLEERRKVIFHEAIHARRLHSFDILLINLLGVFFWFNPLIRTYKKIFVQLHEFEADARAVENRDVDEYCSLLAKVALESAGFRLANHFNNSLTIKRIEMMRTIKRKIKPWKMALVGGVIPLAFMIIACQDQLSDQVRQITQSSTMAVDIPDEVQRTYNEMVKAHPEKKFLLMETDQDLKPRLDELKSVYEKIDQSQISNIKLITPTVPDSDPVRTFAILEYNEQVQVIQKLSTLGQDVFTIVDETSVPVGGIGAFYDYVARNIKYPAEARERKIEGKVFVTFVVDIDGSVTVTEVSGIGGGCELEAMRVMQSSPNWIPGKIKGVPVKQQMVIPITFKLSGSGSNDVAKTPENAMTEMVVVGKQ